MPINIDRDLILSGPATRFEVDGVDLGPTLGPVTLRRETEYTEIIVDDGSTINRFRTQEQMYIEVELASSSFRNLEIAWGGSITQQGSNKTLSLDASQSVLDQHELIIEGQAENNRFMRHVFRKVVSLVQTNQTVRRDGITSIALEFEVLTEPLRDNSQFGKIMELNMSAHTPGDAVADDPAPMPSWTGISKAEEEEPQQPRRIPDRILDPEPTDSGPAVPIPPAAPSVTPEPADPEPADPDIPDNTIIDVDPVMEREIPFPYFFQSGG